MTEPCAGCGEETTTGSVLFSDRLVIARSDGAKAYLCSLCDARIRSSRRGRRRLTDDEVRNAVEHGSVAALTWGGGSQ